MRKPVAMMTLLLSLAACASVEQADSPLVLTSLAPLHEMTRTLTEGSSIRVENIPQQPRSMAAQPTLFARQGENFHDQFEDADAVVTIGKIWAEDSFYTTARETNIRIVNIDASKPWSHVFTGVAVATSPVSGRVSPYFWTSPSNIIRALEIIARDMQTLFPDQADIIATNLQREKDYYISLKADYETRFLEVPDPLVYALTDEFVYLTSDLGIFVDDYFVKQDIDWSGEDLDRLTKALRNAGIRVVIHKWLPSDEIRRAISDSGAALVVLDQMETLEGSLHQVMTGNLDMLLNALLENSL